MCNIQKSSKDVYFIHSKYDFLGYDPTLIWQINIAIYEETATLSSEYMSETSMQTVVRDVRKEWL